MIHGNVKTQLEVLSKSCGVSLERTSKSIKASILPMLEHLRSDFKSLSISCLVSLNACTQFRLANTMSTRNRIWWSCPASNRFSGGNKDNSLGKSIGKWCSGSAHTGESHHCGKLSTSCKGLRMMIPFLILTATTAVKQFPEIKTVASCTCTSQISSHCFPWQVLFDTRDNLSDGSDSFFEKIMLHDGDQSRVYLKKITIDLLSTK